MGTVDDVSGFSAPHQEVSDYIGQSFDLIKEEQEEDLRFEDISHKVQNSYKVYEQQTS